MTDADAPVHVERNDAESRYDIRLGEEPVGAAFYRVDGSGRVVFTHTEIDPAFGGRGLGSALADGALTDAAARGETVVPRCPFIAEYLREHPIDGLQVDWPADGGENPAR
ncbi:GNAT family N-acetyltransferase [Microbacterium caowuchunii]|uniref:N-acetyltransferase n=1 Tax=Microbacterium caowuchunii TaxID=2614638 RepID=A0A5N0T6A3_9MICO|nr:GNAT family N-acetyltransferase [Microbacterium caowuchunii]KAA9130341.1 N-acetyltransferase [Microbacterium caowuchunii]